MARFLIGEIVVLILIMVGAYFSLTWIFRKADREAEAAIKADADGTIKKSRENMETPHE